MREPSKWTVTKVPASESVAEGTLLRKKVINQGLLIETLQSNLRSKNNYIDYLEGSIDSWRTWCYAWACAALFLGSVLMLVVG